jgi:glyoxylase-like metal-dependent hydrolase (beta-lactamase superfamily II)
MICGDAMMNLGGRPSPPNAFFTPDPWLAGKSLQRLADLDYTHLLPAHGPPITDHGRRAMVRLVRSQGL